MNTRVIACPVCQHSLALEGNQWRCKLGHSYDRSRFGYVNLLVAQHKKSKAPGDSLDMVDARQRLLDSGLYQPISDWLNSQVLTLLKTSEPQNTPLHIADIGCGEGYYTQRLQQALHQAELSHHLYGVDISKDALRRGARRSQEIDWLVASGGQLPFLAHSLDTMVCLFTNLMPQGFKRVLKPNGRVLLLNTGANHLLQLREQIYQQVNLSEFDPRPKMAEHGFECEQELRLTYEAHLPSNQHILDLLMMTPHRFKVRHDALNALQQLPQLSVTIDIVLHQFCIEGHD